MPSTRRTRLAHPHLGIYFGIFASALVSLLVLTLMLEQLGAPTGLLRLAILITPLVLFMAIGAGSATRDVAEYFAAGRRVPAAYNGLVLAAAVLGGTGVITMTGLFFINGFDAWCLSMGVLAGFVMMAVLIAPYMRKFGAYTVPSYLGRRFESRLVRVVAASVCAVPVVLVVAAELKLAIGLAGQATASGTMPTALLLSAVLIAPLVLGGMRALGWVSTAQAITALIAVVVPAAILGVLITNLPVAQLSYGPILRAVGRSEMEIAVPIVSQPWLAVDLAERALEPLERRFASPFGSVGPVAFVLVTLSVMVGVASAPWLLPRVGTAPGVYEARKTLGWAALIFGVLMMSLSALAVFLRSLVMDEIVGRPGQPLPEWFSHLAQSGAAGLGGDAASLTMASLRFARDEVLTAIPLAMGFPAVVHALLIAGGVAACLAGAGAATLTLGQMAAEDGISGLRWEPPPDRWRIAVARVAVAAAGVAGMAVAMAVPTDPLTLMLWAFGLSGSAVFPVLVLSIWWKRINTAGAVLGLLTGGAISVLLLLGAESGAIGLDSVLAAGLGWPAGMIAAVVVSNLTPAPSQHVLERVRDTRIPGGEAVHDREMRLLRLKQLRSG